MKRALVVIDVQQRLVDEPPGIWQRDELLATITDLIARARAAGMPVLFVVDDEVDTPGSPGWDVHPALGRRPGNDEPRVQKLACDAFHQTSLEAELRARGIEEIVVAGCKSQYCIDTSCRRAVTVGFPVLLVADAHSTNDRAHLDARTIVAHENATLDGFGVSSPRGPIEIRVLPAAQLPFRPLRS